MNPLVTGEIILYRQFDVGYEILLDKAFDHLLSSAPERPKPIRGEASAIQIPNPPVTVHLGNESIPVGSGGQEAEISARLFDFGVVSLRAKVSVPRMPWDELCGLGAALGQTQATCFDPSLDRLLQRIQPAVVRLGRSPVTEEYAVFRMHQLEDPNGAPYPIGAVSDEEIARLLLSEAKPLSPGARADLLSPRF